jgi:hypothetical protein
MSTNPRLRAAKEPKKKYIYTIRFEHGQFEVEDATTFAEAYKQAETIRTSVRGTGDILGINRERWYSGRYDN